MCVTVAKSSEYNFEKSLWTLRVKKSNVSKTLEGEFCIIEKNELDWLLLYAKELIGIIDKAEIYDSKVSKVLVDCRQQIKKFE